MWNFGKDYSLSYIRKNRASSVSVMAAALISALLLSLLLSLLYSMWDYEKVRITSEEGDFHARLAGEIDEEELALLKSLGNVESVEINEKESDGENTVVDIRLKNTADIYEEMPEIAELIGLHAQNVVYNDQLLSLYLVRNPRDPDGAMILMLFGGVTVLACISLILVIHNAFAVFMNDRVHQFGILSSVGATPAQIRACLLQEAGMLCALPVLMGNLLGMAAAAGLLEAINEYVREAAPDRLESHFVFHPLVFAGSVLCAAMTVLISAWLPARRLSRLTPLEAIRGADDFFLKRKKNSHILTLLFGMEGELAGNALKAQRKALRAAALSLTLSLLAFTLMECVFSLSRLSTRITYWDRYANAWDIMVTVKDTQIASFAESQELSEIRAVSGIQDVLAYQRTEAERFLTDEELSDAFTAAGGFQDTQEGWLISAPLIILDDEAFLSYCRQIGAPERLDGAVIYNEVRDGRDPNFRKRNYLPYLQENQDTTVLRKLGQEDVEVEIPVTAYAHQIPAFREQFGVEDYHELAHFIPASLWEKIGGQLGDTGPDTTIRILTEERNSMKTLDSLEKEVDALLEEKYDVESENRIRAGLESDRAYDALMTIFGSFCVLLAIFGISSVFLNTLSFVRQRRREVARYLSVGMTPEGVRKMFFVEAMVLAGRPVLITLPVAILLTGWFLKTNYLDVGLFLQNAPVMPVLTFILAVFFSVGLAYYLGGRKLMRYSLSEMLRDETML